MIRIHNLEKWRRLAVGETLFFVGTEDRNIQVEVNTEGPTAFHVVIGDQPVFLGVVYGHDTLEFYAGGNVELVPTGEADVWVFSNEDGGPVQVDGAEETSFTSIASRRARNPELEHMMWKMEQNITRRMMLLAEPDNAGQPRVEPEPETDPETGEVIEDEQVSAPVGDAANSSSAGSEPEAQASAAKPAGKGKKDGAGT